VTIQFSIVDEKRCTILLECGELNLDPSGREMKIPNRRMKAIIMSGGSPVEV
jgi:hypothetical protein